jgi:site-specific DNA-methyltransferase (adenine-specific)
MEENSIDTTITDPPYGLGKEPDIAEMLKAWLADEEYGTEGQGFMSQKWDAFVPGPRYWKAVFKVMKPGGTLLAFGGTRTNDLLSIAIRFAGFRKFDEIDYFYGGLPPSMSWVQGSGFSKGANISKMLDKALGAEREVISELRYGPNGYPRRNVESVGKKYGTLGGGVITPKPPITAPATDAAKLFNGYYSCLKPAHEVILCFYKPRDKTFANNALIWGLAGLNVDGARISVSAVDRHEYGIDGDEGDPTVNCYGQHDRVPYEQHQQGRYPANLILECNCGAGQGGKHAEDCVCGMLDGQSGESQSSDRVDHSQAQYGQVYGWAGCDTKYKRSGGHNDKGGCSRFFKNIPVERFRYQAKAPKGERWFYCPTCDDAFQDRDEHKEHGKLIGHPTQKPQALLNYLCTLTRTPTGGTVLDPFMGSGTTGLAAYLTDRSFVGIEINEEYFRIAQKRIEHARTQPK